MTQQKIKTFRKSKVDGGCQSGHKRKYKKTLYGFVNIISYYINKKQGVIAADKRTGRAKNPKWCCKLKSAEKVPKTHYFDRI